MPPLPGGCVVCFVFGRNLVAAVVLSIAASSLGLAISLVGGLPAPAGAQAGAQAASSARDPVHVLFACCASASAPVACCDAVFLPSRPTLLSVLPSAVLLHTVHAGGEVALLGTPWPAHGLCTGWGLSACWPYWSPYVQTALSGRLRVRLRRAPLLSVTASTSHSAARWKCQTVLQVLALLAGSTVTWWTAHTNVCSPVLCTECRLPQKPSTCPSGVVACAVHASARAIQCDRWQVGPQHVTGNLLPVDLCAIKCGSKTEPPGRLCTELVSTLARAIVYALRTRGSHKSTSCQL